MITVPPRSTRNHTLFPYTTRFRSQQHRRQRQARVAGAEQLTAAAGKQLFAIQRRRSRHRSVPIRERANYVSSAVKPRRRSATARPRVGRVLIRINHARTHPLPLRSLLPGPASPTSSLDLRFRLYCFSPCFFLFSLFLFYLFFFLFFFFFFFFFFF